MKLKLGGINWILSAVIIGIGFLPGNGEGSPPEETTFTKVTTGPVVNDGGASWAGAWVDYDNDGWLDLLVTNGDYNGNGNNFLYRNNRDGTFTRVMDSGLEADSAAFRGCAWVDWNNDGYVDFSVVTFLSGNFLYQNNGDGTFTSLTDSAIFLDERDASIVGSWGDYDRDGYLDYFVGNAEADSSLYHNNRDGTFLKVTVAPVATDFANAEGAAWVDYDNDGWPDLFETNFQGTKNFLYHNSGDGNFVRMTGATAGKIVTDSINSGACTWGDYDNDGYLDVYITSLGLPEQPGALYHNKGTGSFERITTGSIATEVTRGNACAWVDYDNDGYLDLFVGRVGLKNLLFHNNGDGTFTKIQTGVLANEGGPGIQSFGAAWGDYNNDGFLDLFVANGGGGTVADQNNSLYTNNGNSNSWLKARCVGNRSNRSGIGVKVRIRATIGGKELWQMREISHGNGWSSSPLEADFGLGDAAKVDILQIEWPSGTVQVLHEISGKQSLVIAEPPRLDISTEGKVRIPSWLGQPFTVQASTDLRSWSDLLSVTNSGTGAEFGATMTANAKFYRVYTR